MNVIMEIILMVNETRDRGRQILVHRTATLTVTTERMVMVGKTMERGNRVQVASMIRDTTNPQVVET